MSVSYYVLWIPQITKENPNILQSKLALKELRDKRNVESLFVRAQISLESRNISLWYSIDGEAEKELMFYYINQDDRGFLIYKLELNDQQNDFLCKYLREGMPNALYHYFKSFFHEHIFHDESEDSLLSPYFSVEPIRWNRTEVRNEVVKRLIVDYEIKFQGALEEYSATYERITLQLKEKKKILRMLNLMDELREQERNTLNERAYCEFLLRSFPMCVDSDRKRTLRNLIKHLEMINLKLESSRNRLSASLGLQFSVWGFWAGFIGIVLGLATSTISIIYAAQQSKNSSIKQEKNIQEIKNIIQEEGEKTRKQECIFFDETQRLYLRIDTLNNHLHKMQKEVKIIKNKLLYDKDKRGK